MFRFLFLVGILLGLVVEQASADSLGLSLCRAHCVSFSTPVMGPDRSKRTYLRMVQSIGASEEEAIERLREKCPSGELSTALRLSYDGSIRSAGGLAVPVKTTEGMCLNI